MARRNDQLGDATASIAAALRAGLSLGGALAYAARETPPPLGELLRDLARQVELGLPVDRAVQEWAEALDTDDARLLASVFLLHRRTGGDLPRVLDQVVRTLRDRQQAKEEVRSLTAQARLSGAILGLLPVAFFAFLWISSRSDIEGAMRTPIGITAVLTGLAMEGVAFLWIRRLLAIA